MEWFVKAFIRASLAWFTLGIALGLAMAAMGRSGRAELPLSAFGVQFVG